MPRARHQTTARGELPSRSDEDSPDARTASGTASGPDGDADIDGGADLRADTFDDLESDIGSEQDNGLEEGDVGDDTGPGLLDDDLAARMRPSKTQRKKQMHDLQDLGEALVSLPANRIAALDLSDTMRTAIADLRNTRSHEGKRRQMQYIGKLMRHVDPEPIREAVAAMQLGSARDTLALHKAEALRKALIDSDNALTGWLADHPGTDVQQMRSLIRAARKDAANSPEQRNGRAYRELFQLIKKHQAEDQRDSA